MICKQKNKNLNFDKTQFSALIEKYFFFVFSEIVESQTKLLIGAAVGAGVAAVTGLGLWYQHERAHAIPKK